MPLPYIITQVSADRFNNMMGCELIFASQHILFQNNPWITDLEFVNALVGYGSLRFVSKIILKAFLQKSCKKILPWSNWAKETLLRSLDHPLLRNKLQVVHYAVHKRNKYRKKVNDEITLLFVGSNNPLNIENFEVKGGREMIEAFIYLLKKFDKIKLIVRSWVPANIKILCEKFPKKIKIIDYSVSYSELDEIYSESDIFVLPSHETLGIAVLEAMSYGLSIVTLGIYDIPEALQNYESALLISPPNNIMYTDRYLAPKDYTPLFIVGIRKAHDYIVKELIEKVSLLIDDASLRNRLGQNAKNESETGNFSISVRNKILKTIFEESLKS